MTARTASTVNGIGKFLVGLECLHRRDYVVLDDLLSHRILKHRPITAPVSVAVDAGQLQTIHPLDKRVFRDAASGTFAKVFDKPPDLILSLSDCRFAASGGPYVTSRNGRQGL